MDQSTEEGTKAKGAQNGALEAVIAKLYDLNVGVVGQGPERDERPHKPVLLLAAIDLIAQGKDKPEHIRWSQELRGTFK